MTFPVMLKQALIQHLMFKSVIRRFDIVMNYLIRLRKIPYLWSEDYGNDLEENRGQPSASHDPDFFPQEVNVVSSEKEFGLIDSKSRIYGTPSLTMKFIAVGCSGDMVSCNEVHGLTTVCSETTKIYVNNFLK